jgi:hypothetical protein
MPDRRKQNKWDAANPEKKLEMSRRWRSQNRERDRDRTRERVRKCRAKKYFDKVSTAVERGAAVAKASGKYMDINDAIALFKAQDNAFDFIEEVNAR